MKKNIKNRSLALALAGLMVVGYTGCASNANNPNNYAGRMTNGIERVHNNTTTESVADRITNSVNSIGRTTREYNPSDVSKRNVTTNSAGVVNRDTVATRDNAVNSGDMVRNNRGYNIVSRDATNVAERITNSARNLGREANNVVHDVVDMVAHPRGIDRYNPNRVNHDVRYDSNISPDYARNSDYNSYRTANPVIPMTNSVNSPTRYRNDENIVRNTTLNNMNTRVDDVTRGSNRTNAVANRVTTSANRVRPTTNNVAVMPSNINTTPTNVTTTNAAARGHVSTNQSPIETNHNINIKIEQTPTPTQNNVATVTRAVEHGSKTPNKDKNHAKREEQARNIEQNNRNRVENTNHNRRTQNSDSTRNANQRVTNTRAENVNRNNNAISSRITNNVTSATSRPAVSTMPNNRVRPAKRGVARGVISTRNTTENNTEINRVENNRDAVRAKRMTSDVRAVSRSESLRNSENLGRGNSVIRNNQELSSSNVNVRTNRNNVMLLNSQ